MTPPASVGEEAAKLLAALQAWAAAGSSAGLEPTHAGEAPECQACPLCQVLRAVRGVRPDVVAHLAGASSELMAALRSALADDTPAGPPRRVERIDVGD